MSNLNAGAAPQGHHNTGSAEGRRGKCSSDECSYPMRSCCLTFILILPLNFAPLFWSCGCLDEGVRAVVPSEVTWLDKEVWLAGTPLSLTALSPPPPNILFLLLLAFSHTITEMGGEYDLIYGVFTIVSLYETKALLLSRNQSKNQIWADRYRLSFLSWSCWCYCKEVLLMDL